MKKRVAIKLLLLSFITLLVLVALSLAGIIPALAQKLVYTLAALNFLLLCYFRIAKLIRQRIHDYHQVPTPRRTRRRTPVLYTTALVLTYLIPALILGYVIYMNWLPFGYEKTYVLDVGREWDTDSSREFYISDDSYLGPRTCIEDSCFREIRGIAELAFFPKAVLSNWTINVTGTNISLIPTELDFRPEGIDFSSGIPEYLEGDVAAVEGGVYFNGSQRLVYPGTEDSFENGSFAVYVEWTPEDNNSDHQEIVGHYNWELWQERGEVRFAIGRMNNGTGPFYSVSSEFKGFGEKHSALAAYNPSGPGYIALYVDGVRKETAVLNYDRISLTYGERVLSFGKSGHTQSDYFIGTVYYFAFVENPVLTSISGCQNSTYLVYGNGILSGVQIRAHEGSELFDKI